VLTVLLDWRGRREKRLREREPSSLLTPLDAVCGLRATLRYPFIINTAYSNTRIVLDGLAAHRTVGSTSSSRWVHASHAHMWIHGTMAY
jgi:hypothetical protein